MVGLMRQELTKTIQGSACRCRAVTLKIFTFICCLLAQSIVRPYFVLHIDPEIKKVYLSNDLNLLSEKYHVAPSFDCTLSSITAFFCEGSFTLGHYFYMQVLCPKKFGNKITF